MKGGTTNKTAPRLAVKPITSLTTSVTLFVMVLSTLLTSAVKRLTIRPVGF